MERSYLYIPPEIFTYTLQLTFNDKGLTEMDWHKKQPEVPVLKDQEGKNGELVLKTLDAYFSKDFKTYAKLLPKIPMLPKGTLFQQEVWQVMTAIPVGEVLSYKQVAEKIDRPAAMRAVGGACGKNPIPILIPCHRIIAANWKLGGFSGGIDRKIQLLAWEGIHL